MREFRHRSAMFFFHFPHGNGAFPARSMKREDVSRPCGKMQMKILQYALLRSRCKVMQMKQAQCTGAENAKPLPAENWICPSACYIIIERWRFFFIFVSNFAKIVSFSLALCIACFSKILFNFLFAGKFFYFKSLRCWEQNFILKKFSLELIIFNFFAIKCIICINEKSFHLKSQSFHIKINMLRMK